MPEKNKYSISLSDLMKQIAEKAQPGSTLLDTAYSAAFNRAHGVTSIYEGGYNAGTNENETVMGIDRRWSDRGRDKWIGWRHVDSLKRTLGIPFTPNGSFRLSKIQREEKGLSAKVDKMNALLRSDPAFMKAVKDYYEINYWNGTHLDQIHDPQIRDNLYDSGVNQGTKMHRIMQKAVNIELAKINSIEPGSMKAPLTVDGIIGKGTIDLANWIIAKGRAADFNKVINDLRDTSYHKDKGFKTSGAGWGIRLKGYGKEPVVKDLIAPEPERTVLAPFLKTSMNPTEYIRSNDKGIHHKIGDRGINKHILTPAAIDANPHIKSNITFSLHSAKTPGTPIKAEHLKHAGTPKRKTPQHGAHDKPTTATNIHIGNLGCGLTLKTEMPLNQLEKYIKNVLMKVIKDSGIAVG